MNITPYSSATLSPASSGSSAELLAAYPALKRWWVHTRGVTPGGTGVGQWVDQVVGEKYSWPAGAGGALATTSEGVNGGAGGVNDQGLAADTDEAKRYTCEAGTTLLMLAAGKLPTGKTNFLYSYGGLDGSPSAVAAVSINKSGALTIEAANGNSESSTFDVAGGAVTAITAGNYIVQAGVFDLTRTTAAGSNRHQVQAATPTSLFTEDFAVNNTFTGTTQNPSTVIPGRKGDLFNVMLTVNSPLYATGGHYSQMALFAFKNLRQNTLMDGIVKAACQWAMGNNSLLYPGFRGIV